MIRRDIKEGMQVVVRYGGGAATPVCCLATVRVPSAEDKPEMVWLDVHISPGNPPLPQMFRPEEILGIPSLHIIQACGVTQ